LQIICYFSKNMKISNTASFLTCVLVEDRVKKMGIFCDLCLGLHSMNHINCVIIRKKQLYINWEMRRTAETVEIFSRYPNRTSVGHQLDYCSTVSQQLLNECLNVSLSIVYTRVQTIWEQLPFREGMSGRSDDQIITD